MKKYVMQPMVVEAVQLAVDNEVEVREWLGSALKAVHFEGVSSYSLEVKGFQQVFKVEIGSWILKHPSGTFHVFDRESFEKYGFVEVDEGMIAALSGVGKRPVGAEKVDPICPARECGHAHSVHGPTGCTWCKCSGFLLRV